MDYKESVEKLLNEKQLWVADKKAEPRLLLSESALSTSIPGSISFGIPDVDQELSYGGLQKGAFHEFFFEKTFDVPLSLFCLLATKALCEDLSNKYAIWIGEKCWPTPHFLRDFLESSREELFFSKSIFLNPPNEKLKLWTFEAAIRCPAVAITAIDIKHLPFALSRRFAISAKKGGGIALVARPEKEISIKTFASTKWLIRPFKSSSENISFELTLLKQKGTCTNNNLWTCEFNKNGQKISVDILPEVAEEPEREQKRLAS